MWKKKLKLNGGDTLHSGRHYQKGSMAEEDVYEYTILNAQGKVVGWVERRDETDYKGTQRQSLVQRDANRNIVVDEHWGRD